jgi:uncharacterized surface protein with fasciclin (FAS1) repeats
MKTRKSLVALAASAAIGLGALATAPSATAVEGTNSLAAVLTAKDSFDNNRKNYDILTAAVLAVLDARPNSAVGLLTDGNVALTAFIPNDGAFKVLVKNLTHKMPKSEKAAFNAVAKLGIPAIEEILLYHVVPGPAILSPAALQANGAQLQTGLDGKVIKVFVRDTNITLVDYNKKIKNPRVLLGQVDINDGNKQIAHGINRVLLPNR